MLRQRVITAIVLLAVLLAALLASSPWPLVYLLGIAAACALWEWLRLTWQPRSFVPVVVALLVGLAMLLIAVQWLSATPSEWAGGLQRILNTWVMPIVAIIWAFAATGLVIQGNVTKRLGGACLSGFALLAILAAWAALVQLYLTYGAWFLISLLALIWFADIAAYFVGKAIGKHKLAPKVSPGKTWEGAVGGVVAATLWVFISSIWESSFGNVLLRHWAWWAVVIIVVLLAALSIVGDLFESLLKRRAGVKDSSHLLPGHGGVYDRIDALLPVAPIALLLTTVGLQ